MNNIRKIIEERLDNAINNYRQTSNINSRMYLQGQIEAYQDCLNLMQPRTEQEILNDFEKDYAIIKNNEWCLILVNEFNHIIEIDKACKRYQCYYYNEETQYLELSTYIEMQEHKLLNELFICWGWL
jgi:hypothetical protein